MPKIKFVASVANDLKPAAKSLEYFASNYNPGSGRLGLRVSPAGKKTWFIAFRMESGGTLLKTNIGTFPALSYSDAKAVANEKLVGVKKGIDPREKVVAKQVAEEKLNDPTFDSLAELYLKHHASKKKTGHKDAQKINDRRLDPIRDMRLEDIGRRHIIDILDTIAETAPINANRFKALLSKMFNFAIRRAIVPDTWGNPALNIDRPAEENPSDRVYSDAEIRTIMKAYDTARADLSTALKIQAYTLQRIDEILGLRWSEIDMDSGLIRFPRERTKNKRPHIVPMSDQVREIMLDRSNTDSEYVFPSKTKTGHLMIQSKDRAKMKAATKIDDWGTHDMRRTGATNLGEMGVSDELIGSILGHTNQSVTSRHYNHSEQTAAKSKALQRWANQLDRIIGKGKTAKIRKIA